MPPRSRTAEASTAIISGIRMAYPTSNETPWELLGTLLGVADASRQVVPAPDKVAFPAVCGGMQVRTGSA